MKALLDPSTLALSAYARIADAGLLESKLARKLFLRAYHLYKRHFEDPFWNLAKKHPSIFRDGHILDVGANVGYTSCVFADVLSDKYHVFSFEPEADNVAYLLESIVDRGLEKEIVPVSAAAGRKDGFVDLWVNKAHRGDHRIVTEKFKNQLGDAAQVRKVDVVSLDSFLSTRVPSQPVSFIKLDVQGYELEVCEGMKGTLARNERVCVAFEYAPEYMRELGFSPRKLLEFFMDRGFELYMLDRGAELVRLSGENLMKRLQSRAYTDLLASRYDPRRRTSSGEILIGDALRRI